MSNTINIDNGMSYEKNGWKYISIWGEERVRGIAYGRIIRTDFIKIQEMMKFVCMEDMGMEWDYFINVSKNVLQINKTIQDNFPEFYEEMYGIAEGINMEGHITSIDEVIAWNNYFTILDSWYPNYLQSSGNKSFAREGGSKDRCSAFICTNSYTKDGNIVCGHNNFSNFIDGQYAKQVLDINPTSGNRMLIQGFIGFIWSGTDFFVSSNGIFGTETTIGGFINFENNFPISCRIRKAMQYGNTLKDYENILITKNSGDYANSWLFGDANTGEIMRIELGLNKSYIKPEIKKDGYFIGFNAPYNPQIRNLECINSGFNDIRRHQGARKVRLGELMEKYKGEIDLEVGKIIMSDHYDVYLNKDDNPCSRTICSHYDNDAREYMSQSDRPLPFQLRGAIDGNLIDSTMAKNMSMLLKYGRSCDIPFVKEQFFKDHPQWIQYYDYINERPVQEWTIFTTYTPEISNDTSISLNNNDNGNANSNGNTNIDNNKQNGGKKILQKNKTIKIKHISKPLNKTLKF